MSMQPYEMTVRRNDWGLGVVPLKPKWPGGDDPAQGGHQSLTFFVHGFNNVLASAERIWRTKTWPALLGNNPKNLHLREVILLYWPGDVMTNRLVSGALYSLQIATARRTADELVTYISRLKGPKGTKIRLRFVAHSLGCRVVLETLKRINNFGLNNVEVKHVLLMAAAVPEGYCRPGKRFGSKFASGKEEVLFSSKDLVLRLFFIPGQGLAMDLPATGKSAVGLTGGPARRWRPEHEDTKLGHGRYWEDELSIRRIKAMFSDDLPIRTPPKSEPRARDPLPTWELTERVTRSRFG